MNLSIRKKVGFTLIELLAVIVILAIISFIAVPVITKSIETSKMETFKKSVQTTIASIEAYLVKNQLKRIPETGVEVTKLDLKKKDQFISGLIKENEYREYEAYKVTNGIYCASGIITNLVIAKDCNDIDLTPPLVVLKVVSKTTNSITLVAEAADPDSVITKYEFAIDSGNYVDNKTNGTFTYTKVSSGEHTLKVRVTNSGRKQTEKIIKVKPNEIPAPTYDVNPKGEVWSQSKIVTVLYPERQTNFVYTYSIDGGTNWVTVASGTKAKVTFITNGHIIAKVDDGTNYKTASTYTVNKIDPTVPTVTITGTVASGTWGTSNTLTANISPTTTPSGYTYQWYKGGVAVSGAINKTLAITTTTNATYTIKVTTGAGGTKTSGGYVVRVDGANPVITGSVADAEADYRTNVPLPSKYFTASAASGIKSFTCINTSKNNVSITNTSGLLPADYVISCTATSNVNRKTMVTKKIIIPNVWVTHISKTGYRVNIYDLNPKHPYGYAFPTWSEKYGKKYERWEIDNIISSGNGFYYFNVLINRHNNECGLYYTHVYYLKNPRDLEDPYWFGGKNHINVPCS